MKNILTVIFICIASVAFSQEYTLLEINSEWNWRNSAKIDKVKGVKHKIAYLEQQTKDFQSKVKSVPLVILYKDNHAIMQWSADISFKLVIKEEQIKEAIESSNNRLTRASTND
jgi:hypothetical protein